MTRRAKLQKELWPLTDDEGRVVTLAEYLTLLELGGIHDTLRRIEGTLGAHARMVAGKMLEGGGPGAAHASMALSLLDTIMGATLEALEEGGRD